VRGLVIAAILLLAGARPARADEPRRALWLDPVMTVLGLGGDVLIATIGYTTGLPAGRSLSVSGTALGGDWHGCGTRSTGGWLTVGLTQPLGAGHGLHGFFVEPSLVLRAMRTSGGEPGQGLLSCGVDDVAHGRGDDAELAAGLGLGWQRTFGALYLGVVLGGRVGYCAGCVDGLPPDVPAVRVGDIPARADGVTAAPTLFGALRLGASF
jgi:hypothetical protein